MSNNKFRYYEVTETTMVKALNKGDAARIAHGGRGVSGVLLGQDREVQRVTADAARYSDIVAE